MCDTRAKRDFLGFFGEGGAERRRGEGEVGSVESGAAHGGGGVQLPLCDTCKDELRRALKKSPVPKHGAFVKKLFYPFSQEARAEPANIRAHNVGQRDVIHHEKQVSQAEQNVNRVFAEFAELRKHIRHTQ